MKSSTVPISWSHEPDRCDDRPQLSWISAILDHEPRLAAISPPSFMCRQLFVKHGLSSDDWADSPEDAGSMTLCAIGNLTLHSVHFGIGNPKGVEPSTILQPSPIKPGVDFAQRHFIEPRVHMIPNFHRVCPVQAHLYVSQLP